MADETADSKRSFWSGTISFGLVTVPVSLFPANRSGGVRSRMLDQDGTPLRRRFICPREERQVPPEELVRGYEIEEGEFVIVSDKELESLEPRKTRDIDLTMFVNEDEIDPLYFSRSYFLVPDGESNKAYRLLAEVMESERKAGVATFVMREKEYLIAIFANEGILRAETLRFQDEVRELAAMGLPKKRAADKKRVAEIVKDMGRIKAPKLQPSLVEDEYAEKLKKLLEQKRKQRKNVVKIARDESDEAPEEVDLMSILKRSLGSSTTARGPRLVRSKSSGKRKTTKRTVASATGKRRRVAT